MSQHEWKEVASHFKTDPTANKQECKNIAWKSNLAIKPIPLLSVESLFCYNRVIFFMDYVNYLLSAISVRSRKRPITESDPRFRPELST